MDIRFYALRLTLDPATHASSEYDTDQSLNDQCSVIERLKDAVPEFDSIVTAAEISKEGVFHTHSVIAVPMTIETLRARVKKEFRVSKTLYNLQTVIDLNKVMRYTMKCNNYVFTTLNSLNDAYSYAIDNPWVWEENVPAFIEQLKELDDAYLRRQFDDFEYLTRLLSVYSSYNKTPRSNILMDRYLRMANERNPDVSSLTKRSLSATSDFRSRYVIKLLTRVYDKEDLFSW